MNKRMKLAVLVSGGGSNLQSIIDAIKGGELSNAAVCCVISDKKGAYAIERAKNEGIAAIELDKKSFETKREFNSELLSKLNDFDPDLIVLAGYLSILPKSVIENYRGRIINIHPALIPKYCGKGFYGHFVHEAVIAANEKTSGATVHYVDEGVDTGAVILQEKVELAQAETAESLAEKVLAVEHRLIVRAIKQLTEHRTNGA